MPDNLARALAALPATVPRPEQCGETVQYLVCDARRFGDLARQDTAAMTAEQAQQAAAEMAQRYGCRVYVLGVVGVVECPAKEPQWTKHMEPV